ncbi:MBL fold metallo-hydrolase [Stieleria varia]|uniref:Ribonuclease Z n=1 Tax=Stieleria varia TaxID=2528005 RepID=A0A5C6AU61_9BACT|nr:MBL fold metallo-hydrolase [Stieleria varia]TWU02586.1 ribonuclease Z [Stieleria varia]
MELHCLGTAGYHPNETRHTSCYFLPADGIVLDAGSGFFRLPELIQTDSLDVLLSHCHLDHVFGLTFLLDVLYQRPVQNVRIWGESEKLAAVREHLFSELVFPVPLAAHWHPIDETPQFHVGEVMVSWRAQDHPGGSVGYRLDWPGEPVRDPGKEPSSGPRRMLYLTDTVGATDAEFVSWASGADLMLHECNFRDSSQELAKKTGHSFASRVGEVARLTRPKKLLVGHVNPLDPTPETMLGEIASGFAGEIEMAHDKRCVKF